MIPKIIWQTHEPEYAGLPITYITNSRTIANRFPDWKYNYVSSNGRHTFIKEHFPEYYQYYLDIPFPVVQADFWRYLVLYKFGGFYVDMDSIYDVDLEDRVDCMDFTEDFYAISRWIEKRHEDHLANNSHIACSENNPVMKQVVDEMINRLQLNSDKYSATDPYMFQSILDKNIKSVKIITMPFHHGNEYKSFPDLYRTFEKQGILYLMQNLNDESIYLKYPKEIDILRTIEPFLNQIKSSQL